MKGLEPGIGYDVMVIAENKKGKSRPAMLHGYTLKAPERQTGKNRGRGKSRKLYNVNLLILSALVVFPFSDFPISPVLAPTFLQIKPFLGTMLGIFGAVVLILSAIILAVRLKGSNRRDRARAISNTITMSSTLSPSLQNGVILRESSSADSIDKNPDIIPQGMYDNSTIALYTHSTDAARMYSRSKLNKIHDMRRCKVIGRNEARKRDNGISRDISSLLSSPTHLLLSRYTFAVYVNC